MKLDDEPLPVGRVPPIGRLSLLRRVHWRQRRGVHQAPVSRVRQRSAQRSVKSVTINFSICLKRHQIKIKNNKEINFKISHFFQSTFNFINKSFLTSFLNIYFCCFFCKPFSCSDQCRFCNQSSTSSSSLLLGQSPESYPLEILVLPDGFNPLSPVDENARAIRPKICTDGEVFLKFFIM